MIYNIFIFIPIVVLLTCKASVEEQLFEKCLQKFSIYNVSHSGVDNTSCVEFNNIPCRSIDFLMSYIENCSSFVLTDKRHFLKSELVFKKVHHFDIIGQDEKGTELICDANSGLAFKYSYDITLKSLHFRSCSFNVSGVTDTLTMTSVLFLYTSNIQLNSCSFANHSGQDVIFVNSTELSVVHSNFSGGNVRLSLIEPSSGGIVVWQKVHANWSIVIHKCLFVNNVNKYPWKEDEVQKGGAITIVATSIPYTDISMTISNSTFINNKGYNGGAINIFIMGLFPSHVSIILILSSFICNEAERSGGAFHMYVENTATNPVSTGHNLVIDSCTFDNNSATIGGAVSVTVQNTLHNNYPMTITLLSSLWLHNFAEISGYAVELNGIGIESFVIDEISITIRAHITDCEFLFNHVSKLSDRGSGAFAATASEINFMKGSTSFIGNTGTALTSRTYSVTNFFGMVLFLNNSGIIGGAMLLMDHSQMFINSSSSIQFINNSASVVGGALYSMVSGKSHCVFTFSDELRFNISFINNLANQRNQSLFIQNAEGCESSRDVLINTFQYFPKNSHIFFPLTMLTLTTTGTARKSHDVQVMPGEYFTIALKELRDWFGLVSTYEIHHMRMKSRSNGDFTLVMPDTADIYLTESKFYVKGPNISKQAKFSVDLYVFGVISYHIGSTTLNVTVVPCRLGYSYSMKQQVCLCASNYSNNVRCSSENHKVCVRYRHWFSNDYKTAVPCPAQNCWFMYGQCPINTEVCPGYSKIYCSINSTDDICWDGRGGFLCSECASNYSFAFRAFQCAKTSTCSSSSTFVILLILIIYWSIFALAILAVLSLNLREGSGFMYGIVYYFSVATIYTSSNPLFSDLWLRLLVYISIGITQLDPELLGYAVRLCFIQSWTNPLPHQLFHYTTPIFVSIIIASCFLFFRYCRLPKKISLDKTSPIHAICMLILFSYTSLCLTNFKILLPAQLFGQRRVRAAPTLLFFSVAHLPYAMIALFMELFIALPVCILFLFAPCISHRVNLVKYKLKPILDEFQACYRPKSRCFAGFYFVARQLVYLIDGLFSENFPQHNGLLASCNVIILVIHVIWQPYHNKWINILDGILLLDIVVLSTYSVSLSGDDVGRVNSAMHDHVIPSLLIIIPTLYLIGICCVGITMIIKKCTSNHCRSAKVKERALNFSLSRKFVHIVKEENENDWYYLADDFHSRHENDEIETEKNV